MTGGKKEFAGAKWNLYNTDLQFNVFTVSITTFYMLPLTLTGQTAASSGHTPPRQDVGPVS